jgi:hypothetical protein
MTANNTTIFEQPVKHTVQRWWNNELLIPFLPVLSWVSSYTILIHTKKPQFW